MDVDVTNSRVLVTGASSGIGAGLAPRFAREGATVALAARRADRLDAVAEQCRAVGGNARCYPTDLAVTDEVDTLARRVIADLGGIDVLVNNAGIPKHRHVTTLDAATVDQVMQVNFLAAARLTLAFLPGMVERGSGRIVNVSSVAATLSSPGEAAYDASKAALAVFGEAMAIDLWETGVRVLTVYPGVVDTGLFDVPDNDPFDAPVDKIGVDEVVDAVFDALGRDALEVYAPGYFKDLAVGKAENVAGFLSGAAEFVREQRIPEL